jgi:hypothetical protein
LILLDFDTQADIFESDEDMVVFLSENGDHDEIEHVCAREYCTTVSAANTDPEIEHVEIDVEIRFIVTPLMQKGSTFLEPRVDSGFFFQRSPLKACYHL